jgi:RNA polymerase sigma-70 factor, ECF subfamily
MADVLKRVAASASAIAVPLGNAGKREDDRELVRLCQNGTPAAFEELVRRHQQRVFGLVGRILRRREDVEDVAQQVFFKAYLSLRKFDHRAAFSTWLYRITVNECWDYLRRKKIRPLVYESDLPEEQVSRLDVIASTRQSADNPADRVELKEALERLLESLPQQDRDLLVLKEVEGFSVQELAEILGLNVNTVKVRLFRARGKLMDVYRHQKDVSKRRGIAGGERKP